MRTTQLTNETGNKVNNHFIIYDSEFTAFQSYNSIIVKTTFEDGKRVVLIVVGV